MQTHYKILIVDDEECMRQLVRDALRREGFTPFEASNIHEAIGQLGKEQFDLLITDLNMPKGDGLELISHIKKQSPLTQIIVITAFPEKRKLKQINELGVSAFLIKPFSVKQLRFSVFGALDERQAAHESVTISKAVEDNSDYGLIGVSKYMKQLRTEIQLMASGDFPVLIQGESGTGKEIIAHAIHDRSYRREEKLVAINCAAIPHHIEESEFFGHAKGAFTGAQTKKVGILESADRSTIFLDEIGELSLAVQAKLLRVLDTGEFTSVGEVSPRKVDIRIVSATNRNLEEMVKQGTFRNDLFYRLRGAGIKTRPLAQHTEDIPYLIYHFTSLLGIKKEVTADALDLLVNFDWKGNIRELKHTVDLIASISKDQERINSAVVKSAMKIDDASGTSVSYVAAKESFEREFFVTALQKHHGNVSRAAKDVGLHRPNLLRKLKELGLSPDDFRKKDKAKEQSE